MPEDYLSFDDALRELQMEEAELRTLVSQGKLRAFRDENTLKFRRSDIEQLRKERETEPTLVLTPEAGAGDEVPTEAPEPLAEEPVDLLGEEALDYDDTAETIIGSDIGTAETGDTELAIAEEETTVPGEAPTQVPTIELTPEEAEIVEGTTADTAVPTFELSEEAGEEPEGAETEVPTMVIGLDEYDDTQVATEDIATEEVLIEEGELEEAVATEQIEEPVGAPEEEEEAERAVGSITASSSFGTGEPLAVREQPSPFFTAFCAIAAIILLIPGGIFFYCLASRTVPDWDFLRSIVETFWELLEVTPPPP